MVRLLVAVLALPLAGQTVAVNLRSRVEAFKGSGEWQEVSLRSEIEPKRTAVVLCDVWDNHWCRGAAGRVNVLAPRIEKFVEVARKRGVLVIHAPSDTMEFYKDSPQRLAILALPKTAPPAPLDLRQPAAAHRRFRRRLRHLRRQVAQSLVAPASAAIRIAEGDLISDKGAEVYNALQARGIARSAGAGRAHQHVHSQPHLRHQADDPVGRPLHPGARPHRLRCTTRRTSPSSATSRAPNW